MRVVGLILLEVLAFLALLVFAAYVAIPLAAPPPSLPTPSIPPGAVRDCPIGLVGCG